MRKIKKTKISKKAFLLAIVILFFIVLSIMTGLLKSPRSTQTSDTVTSLKSVEVKEYRGENLSSISDFVENSIKGPQKIDIQNYKLTVDGLVRGKQQLSYDQVLELNKYSKVVTLNCVEGWSVKILWEGVLIKDLLDKAGVKPGSNTVIFYAYDGYSSSLPLDYLVNNNIIVAYKMNGVIIPPERGFPFIVVAEDKWGYKWVKWITRIEVSNDPNFKGYWEKSGYSQKGTLRAQNLKQNKISC